MKYINALSILLCLVGMVFCIILGRNYVDVGYGLHPYLAATLFIILAALGWGAACLIDKE